MNVWYDSIKIEQSKMAGNIHAKREKTSEKSTVHIRNNIKLYSLGST